jgi:UDP-N-acetylmuramoylalanine--D-glutamate ligase
VTELLGHVWREAGAPVATAGNVGTPLASLVGATDPGATVICECSSFQLEDADAFAPECAVLLNLSPDHLDRHASFDDYVEAKLRIFARQGPDDVAIYDAADPALSRRAVGGEARRVPPGSQAALVEGSGMALLGEHNRANAAAAASAAVAMGIDPGAVRRALASFAGVPHRLEVVRERDGVLFVNDSKATNVAAARAALEAFDGGVRAILGGSLKGGGFEELAGPVAERCVACYLIGEAAGRLDAALAPARDAGGAVRRCADLAEAVTAAAGEAAPGEVVLLAPACASFDAYRDFEERGEHFRALVGELA